MSGRAHIDAAGFLLTPCDHEGCDAFGTFGLGYFGSRVRTGADSGKDYGRWYCAAHIDAGRAAWEARQEEARPQEKDPWQLF